MSGFQYILSNSFFYKFTAFFFSIIDKITLFLSNLAFLKSLGYVFRCSWLGHITDVNDKRYDNILKYSIFAYKIRMFKEATSIFIRNSFSGAAVNYYMSHFEPFDASGLKSGSLVVRFFKGSWKR